MIVYNPKQWFNIIFHKYSRDVFKKLIPAIIFMAIFSGLLTYLIVDYFHWDFHGTTAVHSLLGIVLGLFLVFRTNSAYDRWWEGRRAWGELVNNSRNFAMKLHAMLPAGHADRQFFTHAIPGFAAVLRDHLRELDVAGTVSRLRGKIDFPELKQQPNSVVLALWIRVNQLKTDGIIDGDQFRVLDEELRSFTDIMGVSERIKNSPIPYSYSMYIKKFIFTFITTLPFALITDFYYFTVPIVVMLLYILMSVELIAEEIEDPFGGDVNDLPLTALSAKIAADTYEILNPPNSGNNPRQDTAGSSE